MTATLRLVAELGLSTPHHQRSTMPDSRTTVTTPKIITMPTTARTMPSSVAKSQQGLLDKPDKQMIASSHFILLWIYGFMNNWTYS